MGGGGISHLLVNSPNACNSQDWAGSNLGARNSIQDLSHGWQGPNYSNHYLLTPRMHISIKLNQKTARAQIQALTGDAGTSSGNLTTMLNARPNFLKSMMIHRICACCYIRRI